MREGGKKKLSFQKVSEFSCYGGVTVCGFSITIFKVFRMVYDSSEMQRIFSLPLDYFYRLVSGGLGVRQVLKFQNFKKF